MGDALIYIEQLERSVDVAPEWDGHTPAQAIARIGKLEPVRHGHWIKVLGGNGLVSTIRCSECDNCDNPSYIPGNYCWFCGAKMDGGKDDENT